MASYVQKINGNYLAAYEVIPNSPLAQKIAELDVGAFAVVPLTSGTNPVPDPESADPPVATSHKIIYLTKDSSSTASDPYTEWIYTENNTWEIIGNTSMNLSQYKMVQTVVSDPTVPSTGTTTSLEFIDTISQDTQGVITPTKKALPNATSTNPGIVQLGSDTTQTTAAETVTSTANRTYAIQKDANGRLVVNVPWTDASVALTFESGHDYNPSTNPAVTVSSITSRIEALDVTEVPVGASKTLTSISETDGKISATAVDIQISESQVTNLTTDLAAKADKSTAITNVAYDTTSKKITKTINGTTTDVVTLTQLESDLDLSDKENISNKVTSWSSSPDNNHYPSEKLVKDSLDGKQDNIVFDGTYDSTTNKAATVSSITTCIADLDATVASTGGTNVALTVTETDGKITAVSVTTDNTENKNNKVTAFQSTPDDTHYPSEKLVKDSLDAKANASDVLTGGQITGEASPLIVTDHILQIPKATSGTPASAGQSAIAGDFGVVQIECIEI